MSTKKAYIIHGWEGNSQGGFLPWLKKELENKGYQVSVPDMPDANTPQISAWLGKMQELIGVPDENTILIGHSLGGLAILLYLQSLPPQSRVGQAVLVASVIEDIKDLSPEGAVIINSWLEKGKNLEADKIKEVCPQINAFFSDDDPFIPLTSEQIAREQLGAITVIEHQKGHFNQETDIYEVPEVLAIII